MTAVCRPLSSGQIRARAALAFHARQHAERLSRVVPLRAAADTETPLSPAEVVFGLEQGLIARRVVQRPA